MKDQQTGVMEKQILSAENMPPAQKPENKGQKSKRIFSNLISLPSKLFSLLSTLLKTVNKPKILITLGVLIIIIIVFLALLLLSSDPADPETIPANIQNTASPSPQIDQELINISNEVDMYNTELEKLDTDFNDLQAPSVNLKIEF